ncbi:GNAT family N-acetyltransferase [Thermoplasma sp.]|uniref:GNAT family N-acetyltransferase n=1 Tax=Thermoplasma sp. TaxID=1973142 RepID=UPI0012837967|nr:GNAT family N-acetyltransferase [Thermoplasma sp.]KAA8923538.1 MAG: GNAT family N-acetyltransferase [Thermoplasma sp.]
MPGDIVFDRGSYSDVEEIRKFTSSTWKVGYYADLYQKLGHTGTMEDYVDKVIEKWVSEGSVYVLRMYGHPVATIHIEKLLDGSIMLGGLRIHPDHRGSKLGTRIMKETIEFLSGQTGKLRSAVYSWNEPSLSLVKKFGFKSVEEFMIYTFHEEDSHGQQPKPLIEEYSGTQKCFFIDWKYVCLDDPKQIFTKYAGNIISSGNLLVYFDAYEGGTDFVVNDANDAESFIEDHKRLPGLVTFYVRKALTDGISMKPSSSITIWEWNY